ncbi:TetR/AcrR family transcriptional regulator [Nocardia sp. SSK8]|uniref:TetR/AcrR family transcriptional regulator n=1 Tax=Nocardia sp. SSK8 TaxID=3120154 RepID=UPI00300ABCFD
MPDTPAPTNKTSRLWLGATKEERQQARRYALMDAALDLIGGAGAAAVTVRAVCKRAGLTDRYFYESFGNRDALLAELYQEVAVEAHDAISAAAGAGQEDRWEVARRSVEALVDYTGRDPRKGRLLLVEPFAESILATQSMAVMPTFTRLVGTAMSGKYSAPQYRAMTAIGVTGMLGALFTAWLSGSLQVSRDEFVEHCVRSIVGQQDPGLPPPGTR